MASRHLKSDRFFIEDFTPRVYTPEGMRWIAAEQAAAGAEEGERFRVRHGRGPEENANVDRRCGCA